MKLILSPCLYSEEINTFNLFPLESVLEFITKYLSITLDDYDDAFYNESRLLCPPITEFNKFSAYSNVINMLRLLKIGGNNIHVNNKNSSYCIINPSYLVSNPNEFQNVVDYINEIKTNDLLLFLGENNYQLISESLEITINKVTYMIPIVKNPWTEKSKNFNNIISSDKDSEEVFVNKDLCVELDKEMKRKIDSSTRNGTIYKEYGRIIAYRNNYEVYKPKNPYEKNTDYFIRRDKKYIISTDLLHGHFEVFQGKGKNNWLSQYNFSGDLIPLSPETSIKEMRQTHKVEN